MKITKFEDFVSESKKVEDQTFEAVSPERIAAHAKKVADAKKNVTLLLNNFSKTVSKETDPEKIEDAFEALDTLVTGYVDIMKTAP
jgi:hypothetical protein